MQTSFVYMEKEHEAPEGNPVTEECFSACAPMERQNARSPNPPTSDLTSSLQKPATSFSSHNKNLQGEQVSAYLACMPLFAELAHKTWIGPEVCE